MKNKIISLFLVCVLPLTFGGCTEYSDYSEPQGRIFVSAIGVLNNGGKITVFAETTESDEVTATAKSTYYKATATSFLTALDGITSGVAKQFNLSHCAVVLLQENITSKTFTEITEYISTGILPLQTYFAVCENPQEFFSENTAFGYDLAEVIKTNRNHAKSRIKCTFLDCYNRYPVFGVPKVYKSGKKIRFCGMCFFKNYAPHFFINSEQSRIFSLITDNFKQGTLSLGGTMLNIRNCKVTVRKNTLNITLTVKQKDSTATQKLKSEITALLKLMHRHYGKKFAQYLGCETAVPSVKIAQITEE